jgi:hypothetical protein
VKYTAIFAEGETKTMQKHLLSPLIPPVQTCESYLAH